MDAPREEAIVPFDTPRSLVTPATAFRSTWLTSSVKALRDRGLLERYFAALDVEHHESVLNSVAGVWLPIGVALAHYRAINSLEIPPDDEVQMARSVTTSTLRASYNLALRLVRGAGVTPWAAFSMQKRLWQQTWRGGDVGAFKIGPKEARIEIIGWSCADIPYVRRAMRGVLLGQTELFCTKAYVHEVRHLCSATSVAYRVSWS